MSSSIINHSSKSTNHVDASHLIKQELTNTSFLKHVQAVKTAATTVLSSKSLEPEFTKNKLLNSFLAKSLVDSCQVLLQFGNVYKEQEMQENNKKKRKLETGKDLEMLMQKPKKLPPYSKPNEDINKFLSKLDNDEEFSVLVKQNLVKKALAKRSVTKCMNERQP